MDAEGMNGRKRIDNGWDKQGMMPYTV